MTEPDDLLTAFAAGIGHRLAAKGIGKWDVDSVYAASDVGITVEAMPEAPDHIIALSPYPVSDDPQSEDSVIGLRVRLRGSRDPRVAVARDSAIFDELHGIEDEEVNGVYVVFMWRQASLPLPQPQDANERWERSSTYYARVAWPAQHRTD